MSGTFWEDPGFAERPGRRPWAEIAAHLREWPGKWVPVARYETANPATTMARGVKVGSYLPLRPAGTFESRTRKTGDGEYTVFARYVGEDES